MKKIILENENKFWLIPDDIDIKDFDLSWRPGPYEPPFIHQFGTQWQKTGGPQLVVEGATQIKYEDSQKATALTNENNRRWRGNVNIVFDYSWHPDSTEPPFIYQFGTQWQKTGGPRYVVPGATQVKFMDMPVAQAQPCLDNWENYETHDFDYSWVPDENEPPFIYQFANQWQKTGGPRYVVPGATSIKYVPELKAIRKPCLDNWQNYQYNDFDYSWLPDEHEPPFIYQFPNQWQLTGGPRYVASGATQVKYMQAPFAAAKPCLDNWQNYQYNDFDYSWLPDEHDPPFIYQFPNQWQKTGGPKYVVPGATKVKYMQEPIAVAKSCLDNWENYETHDFDYSWLPDEHEPPFIYQFPNQWQKTGGPKYVVPGATKVKYMQEPVARVLPCMNNWQNHEIHDFDYSWLPDEHEPPFIYQFSNQWQEKGGPRYVVPGATEIKYLDSPIATHIPEKKNGE